MKKITNILAAAALTLTHAGCNDDIEMRRPPKFVLPELPDVGNIHTYKAPLYWSVYEYCYTKEQAGVSGADMDGAHGAKRLKVGPYDNPLWIHGPSETLIEGTDYTFGSLRYNGDPVVNPGASDMWFSWAVATHPGAREYIDGFFKHYHELGIR